MAHEFHTQLERLRREFTASLAMQAERLNNPINRDGVAHAGLTHARAEAQGKSIFIIDPDPLAAALCAAHLQRAGFEVEYFDDSHSCIQRLFLDSPAAILMDPDFEHSAMHALGNLHQIKALLTQETPILLMSTSSDANAKIRSLRAGASDYLTKSLDFNDVIETLINSITQHTKTQRVMIVDDDPSMTSLQAEILRYAGMEVACVNQPLDSLELAGKFKPSLVILDMHMPEINGIELALLLRQDPQFLLLPIIFVTADTDTNLHKSIKALGVNALLTKPFDITDLISVCEQALADTSTLKGRIARLTRQAQQPQQMGRSYFFAALEEELHNNSLGNQNSALYYFSIDKLQELSGQLDQTKRAELHSQFCRRLSEIVGRDERWIDLSQMVACVLAGKRSMEFHRQRGEQFIRHLSSEAYSVGSHSIKLQIKLGLAQLTSAMGSANMALLHAEQAFESTISGATVGNPSEERDRAPPDRALPDISRAVLNRDMTLALQPIITLEDAQIKYFSVHTRLQGAQGESIAAGALLNHISQSGKRLELDRWVLQQAVGAIAANTPARAQVTLFIQPAEDSLRKRNFLVLIANQLRSSQLWGEERLVFMLEESWVLNHFPQTREIGKALRDIHCGIGVNRAGEDERLLTMMEDLALNYLRLSPKLTGDGTNPKLLERLIAAATGRGIKVIATEIENSHNLSSLWMQGVRLFEGFSSQPATSGFHLQNDIIFAKEFVQGSGSNSA